MSSSRHLIWVALLWAAPVSAQQRIERFEATVAEAGASSADFVRSPRDTHALTGLLIGGTSGALIGTLITGFGCVMVETTRYASCTAGEVLFGTWLGGSIGGGVGLLIGLLIPRDRAPSERDADARTREES